MTMFYTSAERVLQVEELSTLGLSLFLETLRFSMGNTPHLKQ